MRWPTQAKEDWRPSNLHLPEVWSETSHDNQSRETDKRLAAHRLTIEIRSEGMVKGVSMSNPDSLFYAWLAGFVDGEGCFSISKRKSITGRISYHASIAISNTFRQVLMEISSTLGYGSVGQTAKPTSLHRASNQYQASGVEALMLAQNLRPHLRVKGAQADVFLRYPFNSRKGNIRGAISDDDYILRGQLFLEMKALNTRGM